MPACQQCTCHHGHSLPRPALVEHTPSAALQTPLPPPALLRTSFSSACGRQTRSVHHPPSYMLLGIPKASVARSRVSALRLFTLLSCVWWVSSVSFSPASGFRCGEDFWYQGTKRGASGWWWCRTQESHTTRSSCPPTTKSGLRISIAKGRRTQENPTLSLQADQLPCIFTSPRHWKWTQDLSLGTLSRIRRSKFGANSLKVFLVRNREKEKN